MSVVADTSPSNYLLLIDEVRLLPLLYEAVIIPGAVAEELSQPGAPDKVSRWIARPPSWLRIQDVAYRSRPELSYLDRGESEAIELALELGIQLILIDETEGRRIAESLHLRVRGTLGILIQAGRANAIDLPATLTKLEATNFHPTSARRQLTLQLAGK